MDFAAGSYREALNKMELLGEPRNDFSYLNRFGHSFDASLRHVHSTTSAHWQSGETYSSRSVVSIPHTLILKIGRSLRTWRAWVNGTRFLKP